MKCPRCHKSDLADYSNLDILTNIAYKNQYVIGVDIGNLEVQKIKIILKNPITIH